MITANAKTKPGNDWDNESSAPELIDMFNFTATGPMDNFSFDSVEQVNEYFKYKNQVKNTHNACISKLDKRGGANLKLKNRKRMYTP